MLVLPAISAAGYDITVRRLGRVVDEHARGRQTLVGLTTREVKMLIFVPVTAVTKLLLCEQLGWEGDAGIDIVNKPTRARVVFVFKMFWSVKAAAVI